MTFVSYAQNFEDVMLWRALKNVENGFYVDIGAQDPVVDSVSLAFYEHGWRGVHIEPTAPYAEKLRQARPDETVIQAAVGLAPGPITFFEIPDTGLATGDEAIAERHRAQGFKVKEITVPCLTLTQALKPYVGREIHWMKIDVEGFEEAVIEGWDSQKIRPWVLIVESTAPLSEVATQETWEPQVLERGYQFAYFDGLNRYYVAREHKELLDCFGRPANVFDGFALSGTATNTFSTLLAAQLSRTQGQLSQTQESLSLAQQKLAARDVEIARLNADMRQQLAARDVEITRLNADMRQQLAARDAEVEQIREQASEWKAQVVALQNSTSWKLTKPVRAVRRLANGDVSPVRRASAAITLKAKQILRHGFVAATRQVSGRHQRLPRGASDTGPVDGDWAGTPNHAAPDIRSHQAADGDLLATMTPRARQIHADLKAAIEKAQARRR